jgi:STE24 endopeptidase
MNNLYSYYTQVLFLCFIVLNHVVEIYLSRRQLQTLQQHQGEVPEAFRNSLSLIDHHKAIQYATARLNLSQVHLVWETLVLFYWFPLRGAEKLFLAFPDWGIHRQVLFLVAFSATQMLIGLPWSLYSTFVLEERFGFNRTTVKLFFLDRLKGLILGAIIGLPLLYGVLYLFENMKHWWLVSFIAITLFQFLLVWIYPTVIAPLFNVFHPLEEEELKTGIEKLVTHAGFKSKGVFIMDASKRSSHGNAYFTGFGQNKRIVFFDTLYMKI